MSQVHQINVALAAERSLAMQLNTAKEMLAGTQAEVPGSQKSTGEESKMQHSFGFGAVEEDDPGDQIQKCADQLRTACRGAQMSALEEATEELVPEALEVA